MLGRALYRRPDRRLGIEVPRRREPMSDYARAERAQTAAGALVRGRLAGHEPDSELEAIVAAWVDGELTLDELRTRVEALPVSVSPDPDPRSNR